MLPGETNNVLWGISLLDFPLSKTNKNKTMYVRKQSDASIHRVAVPGLSREASILSPRQRKVCLSPLDWPHSIIVLLPIVTYSISYSIRTFIEFSSYKWYVHLVDMEFAIACGTFFGNSQPC